MMKKMGRSLFTLLIKGCCGSAGLLACLLLVSCGSVRVSHGAHDRFLPRHGWGIAPFYNNSSTPQAHYRAMSLTAGILRTKGIGHLMVYRPVISCKNRLMCPFQQISKRRVMAWARAKHLCYLVSGSVNEWRYKVGLDGEPAVSLSLKINNICQHRMVWSAVGSKTGTSWQSVGVTAQSLISQMMSNVKVADQ